MVDTKSHIAPDRIDPGGIEAVQQFSSHIRARSPMTFGHYELVSRLRVGGMAEVWKARDVDQSEQLVAIKRILPSFTDEADYVSMFIDEARLGLRLRHPHIVQAFELGKVEDEHYIALELVEGQDAAALIRLAREQNEPVPVAIACRVALAVCEALHYAHELRDEHGAPLGVVHRDVSPQNILISYDGDVKLIDFGIAKSAEQVMRTQAGLLKGKHGYLSPEQAMGHDVDRRTDVWSLAICLYELLSAKRLFLGSSDFSTIVRVRKAEIPQLRALNAAVPDELAAIVHRGLERDKAARYQSAEAMHEALLRFVEGSGEQCTAEDLGEYMRARFGDGAPETRTEPGARPDAATGLLDAFDGLEPPSAMSQLSAMPPEQLDETVSEDAPTDPPLSADSAEEADLLEDAESYEGLDEPDADGEGDPLEPLDEQLEARGEPTEVRAPAGVVTARPDGGGFDDADEELQADPTRVVAYESTQSGELSGTESEGTEPSHAGDETDEAPTMAIPASAVASAVSAASSAGAPAAAAAATLPGLGMEWDDEELSTQIYDPPSYSSEAAGVGAGGRADVTPGRLSRPDAGALSSLRPGAGPTPVAMPLPFASTPSIAPQLPPIGRVSLPPPGALPAPPIGRASVPPPAGGLPSPFAALPPQGSAGMPFGGTYRAPTAAHPRSAAEVYAAQGPSRRALLLATLAAVAVVAVVFGGLALFGKPAKATIHVATDPPDARVTLDGVPAPGTTSPFILTDVTPDVTHEIEVQAPGHRTWRTRLTVRPGKVEELPRVQLMKIAPAVASTPTPTPAQPATQPGQLREKPSAQPKVAQRESGGGGGQRVRPKPSPRPSPGPGVGPAPKAAPQAAGGAGTGTLRLNSRPWSRVLIDGRPVGNTPQTQLVLSAGWHTVTLSNPDFGLQKVITVRIKPGEVTTKIVDLQ